jgi:hypothetical protein
MTIMEILSLIFCLFGESDEIRERLSLPGQRMSRFTNLRFGLASERFAPKVLLTHATA